MTEFDPYPKDFIPISKVWFLCIRVISSDIWSFFRSIMIYSQIPSDLDPRRTSGISKCDPAIPERGSQPAQTAASSTLSASHTKVGSLSDPPGYVNQVPPLSVPTSSVYSSPPALPTPVTLNPTAPPLQVGFPVNLAPTTGPPTASQGYVTFNSVKSTGTTEAASPGYITLSQLSPSKEVVESKENGNLSPSSLPPGYSRVGLNSTSPGYVAWDSPPPAPEDGEKLSLPSFEPPRQLEKEEDRDPSLVIVPRALVRESIDSTGLASMV